VNAHARSPCHKGRKVDDLPFELEMKDWVMEQRSLDIAVRMKDIINKMDRVQNCLHGSTSFSCTMVYLCAVLLISGKNCRDT
jgi:hypothetical protein